MFWRMTRLALRAGFREAVATVRRTLGEAGLGVSLSFDLLSALDGLAEECRCEHHGTPRCTCQYAVLLVREPGGAPGPVAVVNLHHRQGSTWAEVRSTYGGDPALERRVARVLAPLASGSEMTSEGSDASGEDSHRPGR